MPARSRKVTVEPPEEEGVHQGLAYSLFLPPDRSPAGVVLVLHGAGSRKESHHDAGRNLRAHGLGALVLDARGHGASPGRLDGRALEDVAVMAGLARERTGGAPVGLRGSSMGGWTAICAARDAGAAAVCAICPASAAMLRRGLAAGRFDFAADAPALDALLAAHEPVDHVAAGLGAPLLLQHAEGDEVVPVEHSRALAAAARAGGHEVKLVAVPGGHHRSVQHDPELQDQSVRWLRRALSRG